MLLCFAPRGFSPGNPGFPSLQSPRRSFTIKVLLLSLVVFMLETHGDDFRQRYVSVLLVSNKHGQKRQYASRRTISFSASSRTN